MKNLKKLYLLALVMTVLASCTKHETNDPSPDPNSTASIRTGVLASNQAATTGNLNTTQIAHDLLGPAMRVYHQDLTTHGNQPRLKIDKLGAGDFSMVEEPPVANSNKIFQYGPDGLLIAFDRPQNMVGPMGISALVNLQGVDVPERFMLTATFQEPKQILLSAQSVPGTFAAALAFYVAGATVGTTSQFRSSGQRLNFPGKGGNPANRLNIAANLYNEVIAPQNPAPFTLVLLVDRTATSSTGEGRLYVGNQLADAFAFAFENGLTAATVIDSFGVGLATASAANGGGSGYRVSLRALEFEVWAPTPNH